jgi:ribosomal protein S18 acetylase RimI-like enzyme
MLSIANLQYSDIAEIVGACAAEGWNKPASQYEHYLEEQDAKERDVLVARRASVFAGYVTVRWRSDYPPFAERDIPEIQDFNVMPPFRRRHIGAALMDEAERRILARSPVIGIGVGLHHDYGAAQRLYVLRGYVPDARGITSHGRRVNWGDDAKIDDDLVLWLTKAVS